MQELTGVSETLLLTLYARSLEAQRPDGIISDPWAIELVRRAPVDFSRMAAFKRMDLAQVGVAVRTELIDQICKAVLAEGLLMYFVERDVRRLVSALADAFSTSEVVFDAKGPLGVWLWNRNPVLSGGGATQHWAVFNLKSIERWDPRFRLLRE